MDIHHETLGSLMSSTEFLAAFARERIPQKYTLTVANGSPQNSADGHRLTLTRVVQSSAKLGIGEQGLVINAWYQNPSRNV